MPLNAIAGCAKVEDVCSREVSENELSHLLGFLLDFDCDEKILKLYKMVL